MSAKGDDDKDKKDEEEEEVKDEPKGEEKPLVRGDYMIHVYVEQAKKFNKLPAGDKIDPLVNIEIMGQKENTKACEDIDNMAVATWN